MKPLCLAKHQCVQEKILCLSFLFVVLFLFVESPAAATTQFTFESSAEGWNSQATEPFSVEYASGKGLWGGGALAISNCYPSAERDSFQIVHAPDINWPTDMSLVEKITVDVRLMDSMKIVASDTGVQVIDHSGNESVVFGASNFIDLGAGWTRIEMTLSGQYDLPMSHDDTGLNLHFQIEEKIQYSLAMYVDNITIVPEPATMVLLALGGIFIRKRK